MLNTCMQVRYLVFGIWYATGVSRGCCLLFVIGIGYSVTQSLLQVSCCSGCLAVLFFFLLALYWYLFGIGYWVFGIVFLTRTSEFRGGWDALYDSAPSILGVFFFKHSSLLPFLRVVATTHEVHATSP